ncbi:MAG: 2-oxoacid:acceptor oxidoreductase family protein, partial [bacterium]
FLELLKPDGALILNTFTAIPVNFTKEDYPAILDIENALQQYNVIKIDATQTAHELGDAAGKSANVVVLGVLSTVAPFDLIPEGTWLSALASVSPNKTISAANRLAFLEGRKLLVT